MAMETVLVGCPFPLAKDHLSALLAGLGFVVICHEHDLPRVVGFKSGWLSYSKKLILELSPIDNNTTRIDISAFRFTHKLKSEDELLEEKIASAICEKMKTPLATN
jgi:hypothetical protein